MCRIQNKPRVRQFIVGFKTNSKQTANKQTEKDTLLGSVDKYWGLRVHMEAKWHVSFVGENDGIRKRKFFVNLNVNFGSPAKPCV